MLRTEVKIKAVAATLALVLLSVICFVSAENNADEDFNYLETNTTAIEITSNRHAQAETYEIAQNSLSLADYEMALENEKLELWLRKSTGSVCVVNKSTGYIWGMLDGEKGEGLNKSWSSFGNSICAIDYYNSDALEQRIGMSDSRVKTTYAVKGDTVGCRIKIKKLKLELEVTLKLYDDSLGIELDDGSVVEEGGNLIKSLYLMPFFGSTYENKTPGYMFIPDGSGALIRYRTSLTYTSNFDQSVYGKDAGIDTMSEVNDLMANRSNDYVVDTEQILAPVYGIVHGVEQNAVFSVIESGEEYANIIASVAGMSTPYNWVTARFDYRSMFSQSTGTNGVGITKPTPERNLINPALRFYFLENGNADYVGMAMKYKEILKSDGVLFEERVDKNIPLQVTLVGSDVKDGFIFKGKKVFTTAEQAKNIVQRLYDGNITNLTLMYEGWQKGGLNGADYGETHINSRLGGNKGFSELESLVSENGGRFSIISNPVTANTDQINRNKQSAKTRAYTYANFLRPDSSLMYPTSYFLRIPQIVKAVTETVSKQEDFNISFDKLGYTLYSDYTRNDAYTRTESKKKIIELISGLSDSVSGFYQPNEYLWKYADEIYDMPVSNSQYLYETDSVPFLQMVLKGSIDYYAPYSNRGFYSNNCILKMIEYGMYPSFMLMAAENTELYKTPFEEYYSLNFDDWQEIVSQVYGKVNSALSAVEGSEIVDYKVLKTGVVRIDYSNNATVFVNYTDSDFAVGNVTVPAEGYFVERG